MAHDSRTTYSTHAVENQPPPLVDYNVFTSDTALVEGVRREGAEWAEDRLRDFGAEMGSSEVRELGMQANRFTPELHTHDRYGNRIDEVSYHPAYHEMMKRGVEAQVHALPWNEPRKGAHVARVVLHALHSQAEPGTGCPLTMTFAVVPALKHQPEIAAEWIPRVISTEYDPRFIPASEKKGAIMGMAMTEKQGGSDVRANKTSAVPIGAGGPGGEFLLTGHKWFCSAPMSDAFLTLANTEEGMSCFLVPRWLPDGTRNRFFIQRLKEKAGNCANASSEIEYSDTWAVMIGEEGRGVQTIIAMVQHTRLDCLLGSASIMRQSVSEAIHHANHRVAFGKQLRDQPLMKNVLADLALESEAATTLMLRIARAFDDAPHNPAEADFARLATAVSKYWVCKRTPQFTYEAMECQGANAIIEENIMARLYREAPINSIWEGSGNIMCLDVLRAMGREPESVFAFLAEIELAQGANKYLDAAIKTVKNELRNTEDQETRARRLTETLALTLQASLLVRHAPSAVSDAFCASRLGGHWGREYGTLSTHCDFDVIINRAEPQLD